MGGGEPIVQQSMLTCSTLDTDACIDQSMALVDVGCQIIRITAQTKKYSANLENILAGIRARGSNVPVVADIHFKPDAAMEAVKWCEMVRVNPGNYADSKKFVIREYTDEQYAAELERIEEQFAPLVEECKMRGRALRIGTNHGSLSDRIMNRFGDTPLGMVESALEFARSARDLDFHNFKFSMKSSNPKVMIECYRLLAARLAKLGPDWNYPLHLGVTEAGDGEDGRIKSAIGIGSLLCDGLGDTIRVSLTPKPGGDRAEEVRVAQQILQSLGIRHFEPQVTACPGCGRTTSTFFQEMAEDITDFIREMMPGWRAEYPGVEKMDVAVMGCVVNGPGESKYANIGISLPGNAEAPKAPVYIDGAHSTTLKGDGLVDEFKEILQDYVKRTYGAGVSEEGAP